MTTTDADPIKVKGIDDAHDDLLVQLARLEDTTDALAVRFAMALRPATTNNVTYVGVGNLQTERSGLARDIIAATERIEEKVDVLQDLIDRCDLPPQLHRT